MCQRLGFSDGSCASLVRPNCVKTLKTRNLRTLVRASCISNHHMNLRAYTSVAATRMGIAVDGYGKSWISMELRWVRRTDPGSSNVNPRKLRTASVLRQMIPIYVSENRRDVNPQELRELYETCNHSCNRFPETDADRGGVKEVVGLDKLCTALSHSYVVSVFCKPEHIKLADADLCSKDENDDDGTGLTLHSSFRFGEENGQRGVGLFGSLFQKLLPVTPSNSQLVGFGRAVSDFGLTASIYDIMVIPPLRGMGIGKLIVKRIIRSLTSAGVYDIAALCSEQEREFFRACGFGDDTLGATTMMYTRRVVGCAGHEDHQQTIRVGKRLLAVPAAPKPTVASSRTMRSD